MVQDCFSLPNQGGLCSPLGSDIHDQDDLSLELLEIVLLVAREFGLEVVEFGHCSGEVWRGSEKLTVKVGRKQRWPNTPQQNRGRRSNLNNHGHCNHGRSEIIRFGHVLATRRHPSRSPSSITAYHNIVGMSDGKRLNSSLDLLKRHYPHVASLRDYIYSILDNATEITLVIPDDPEEYRDLLENSMVGCHQPPCRKYCAGPSVFEIDEVDTLNPVSVFDLHTVRSSKGRSGASSVPRVLQKISSLLGTRHGQLESSG
jgi:hypothetical protein